MKAQFLRVLLLVGIGVLVVACGTVATPINEVKNQVEELEIEVEDVGGVAAAVAATSTPTPIPPTTTPTPISPTATFTPEPPTATPTDEPVAQDPIVAQVALSRPANGEQLFNQMVETSTGGWACITCHSVDTDEIKVGPSQKGIADRAGTRVEGQVAERYLYNSIINPDEYLVEGFADALMPEDYSEIFTNAELLDIVAYLMTLTG